MRTGVAVHRTGSIKRSAIQHIAIEQISIKRLSTTSPPGQNAHPGLLQ
jgi:hypothetical protein